MIKKRYGILTVVCVAALLFFGCGGPLSVNYGAKKEVAGASFKLRSPATVLLKPYLDLRSEKNPRRIGTVTATVADMTGNKLILSQDVSTLEHPPSGKNWHLQVSMSRMWKKQRITL